MPEEKKDKLEKKDRIDLWLKFIGLVGSVILFGWTLYTWSGQNDEKRVEFLESRIKEFNDSSMYLAKEILDGFAVQIDAAPSVSDHALVTIGSTRGPGHHDIVLSSLEATLLPYPFLRAPFVDTANMDQQFNLSFDNLWDLLGKPEYDLEYAPFISEPLIDTVNSKQRVRASFDDLLDFFGKLEYYLRLGLMKEKEVSYFRYYIDACAENKGVIRYAKHYNFNDFLAFLSRFNSK